MTSPGIFDLIVIGAGPGGYTVAAEAAASGLSVALIEKELPGGTCLNRGCIPTKALCHSAADCPDTPYTEAIARKDEVVTSLRQGVESLISKTTVYKGEALIRPQHIVEVNGETLTAPRIIIATGSAPATLPIEGAALTLDSTDMLSLTELPESIAIIGGGVIGMEFASMLNLRGVKVTVIEYCKEILPAFDPDIAKRLRMSLKKRGVEFVTSAAVTAVSRVDDSTFQVDYTSKDKPKSLTAQKVLMAVGRKAVVPRGAEESGIVLDRRGFIVTDNNMQTSVEGIFAIGDVNGRCLLAHAAEAQGRKVLGLPVDLAIIPSVAFTNPPCSMVGMTPAQCEASGFKPLAASATYYSNGYAVATGQTEGMVKMLFHPESLKLVGCSITGAGADLMIATPAMAMLAGADLKAMQSLVYAHPTLSEILSTAARNLQ